jgi:hypothetical protein
MLDKNYLEMWHSSNIWEGQNLIPKEIRGGGELNSYKASLSFSTHRLLSNNVKLRIYKTIIFPAILCGYYERNMNYRCLRGVAEEMKEYLKLSL